MQDIIGLFAGFFLLFGLFFSFVGVVGVIRLPDTYSRLHASGKVGTLGLFGLMVGGGLLAPENALKFIAMGIFMVFSAPLASHSIGAAVRRLNKLEGNPLDKFSTVTVKGVENLSVEGAAQDNT